MRKVLLSASSQACNAPLYSSLGTEVNSSVAESRHQDTALRPGSPEWKSLDVFFAGTSRSCHYSGDMTPRPLLHVSALRQVRMSPVSTRVSSALSASSLLSANSPHFAAPTFYFSQPCLPRHQTSAHHYHHRIAQNQIQIRRNVTYFQYTPNSNHPLWPSSITPTSACPSKRLHTDQTLCFHLADPSTA